MVPTLVKPSVTDFTLVQVTSLLSGLPFSGAAWQTATTLAQKTKYTDI